MPDLLGVIASALMSQTDQPVYVKNKQHQWIYVNAAAAKLMGLSVEAMVGRSEADFLPQQVAQQLRRQDDLFFTRQQASTAPLMLNKTAQIVGHRQLIEVEGQLALVNTLQDVTELAQIRQHNKGT